MKVPEKGWGIWSNLSLFALIVNYWVRTLHCSKQAQMMLLQCLNVQGPGHFSCYYYFLFASPANICHIDDIKRGAADRKPWSSVLKLSSFFGRHMIRVTGMRNPDAGAGSAKICTTGCQAPNLWLHVWNPDKGAGLAKSRREQSSRRAFCTFS